MNFTEENPPAEYTLQSWVNGPYSIVVCPFAFGQFRVQLWHYYRGRDEGYPDLFEFNW